ncbi:Nucleolar protein 14 [Plasmodiophora brassicae]
MGKLKTKSAVDNVLNRAKRSKTAPPNPFARVTCAPKRHVVLGRRIKGAKRDVTEAKTRAILQRQQSLLTEFKRHELNQYNRFVDNRFGQNNPNLTAEEKNQLRFEKQRAAVTKSKSKVNFNLDDDSEMEDAELTHFGASLSSVLQDEQQEAVDKARDEQEQFELDRKLMEEEAARGEGRTRREILQEVIAKSKAYKAEAAVAKEEDELLLANLDQEWAEMRAQMDYTKGAQDGGDGDDNNEDDFEKIARALSTQAPQAASDRQLTEEEAALKAKERLEELEKERLSRMQGVPRGASSRSIESERLEDTNCEIDPEFVLSETSDDEEDSVEEVPMDDDDGDTVAPSDAAAVCASGELPFVIPVPETLQEFIGLLGTDDVPTKLGVAIERIRACSHVALHPDNSIKLQKFLRILFLYFRRIWADKTNGETVVQSDILVKAISTMSNQFPRWACELILKKLLPTITSCINQRTDLPVPILVELQLVIQIFSVSDFAHSCMTPLLLVLCHFLSSLKRQDRVMHNGLRSAFLCEVLLQYVSQSKRFVAELLSHLHLGLRLSRPESMSGPVTINDLFDSEMSVVPRPLYASLVRRASDLYVDLPSFPELFAPFVEFLETAEDACSAQLLDDLRQRITEAVGKRRPLSVAKPPPMIRQRDPVFQDDFIPGVDRDPDPERRERRALLKKMRSEKKGARRELRRDAQFVEAERRNVNQRKAEAAKAKQREIRAFLEKQQADTNALRLSKRRK